jgi:Thymidylate kinase
MSKGQLIVMEGLDGSGKQTQSTILEETLRGQGRQVSRISFPNYESPAAAPIKMYLAGEIGTLNDINAYAASSFYAVDRYVSFQTNWKTPYNDGNTIIADRYTTANAYHQMSRLDRAEWDTYLDWLWDFEFGRLGLPRPDLVLYLDMHPEISWSLIEKRYEGDASKRDLHEANYNYLLSCREAAIYAAARLGWTVVPCFADGKPLTIEHIAGEILKLVDAHLAK